MSVVLKILAGLALLGLTLLGTNQIEMIDLPEVFGRDKIAVRMDLNASEGYYSPYLLADNSIIGVSSTYYPSSYVLGVMYKSSLIDRIIQCESGWNNSARGKAGEIGLAQFKIETFNWMSELAGFEGSIYNPEDQVWLLQWGLRNGYSSHWTCYGLVN